MRRNRPLRLATSQMVESLGARMMLCAGHFNWDNFETTYPMEAAMLKGDLPPAYTDAPAQEGGANIVWINRGLASDQFSSTFGANAGTARGVVDAVLRHYERVINSFNQPGGGNTVNVTISMDTSGTGLGGGAGSYAVSNGYMTGGAITLDRGSNGSGSGWYLDAQPDDFAEFNGQITNAFAVDAPVGSPARGLSDLYTVVMAEMTHVLGINSNASTRFNDSATREWTDTNQADTAEGGGIGTFHVFRGDLINHLMTSNNGGSGGSDRGVPLHGAGPGVNVSYASQTWIGAQDAMNAVYEGSRRYLVPETSRLIMADAYGYSTNSAALFGTGYANLNLTTGVLTIRGGDAHSGNPVTNDKIYVAMDGGGTIRVTVDVPADIAGTYTSPGGGDFPGWTSEFSASQVNSIVVDGNAGDDDIYIQGVPSGVTLVVNAGSGNDYVQIGNGDVDDSNTGVMGNVTVNGGTGTDSVLYFDLLDDVGNDTYTITSSTITKPFSGVITYNNADVELLTVDGSGLNNTFDVNSSDATVPMNLSGFGGDDTYRIDVDFDNAILGNVSCLGGTGTDTVTVNDSLDIGLDDYLVTGNRFEKSSSTGAVFASSSTESMNITCNNSTNDVNVPQLSSWMNVTIHGGDGNETFTVANNNFDANLLGTVSVDGGLGTDSLLASDTSDTGDDSYNYYNNRIDKGGATYIGYTAIESCLLNANGGANTITLFSSTASIPTTINGNNGDDSFRVNDGTSFLFNFGGDVTLNGGVGDDSLSMTDTGFAGTGTYTLTNGHIVAPFNSFDVIHNSMSFISVNGSKGNNTFNVDQTDVLTFVLGDDGDDTINVGGDNFDANIGANVLVAGGNGNDYAYYRDALDTGNDTYTLTSGGITKPTSTVSLLTSFFGPTIDNVWLVANGESNVINVESTGSSTTPMNFIVSAGLGDDTMNVTPTTKDISGLYGNVTLNGEGGTDAIVMDDFLAAGGDTTVLAGGLTKNDWTGFINYGGTATNEKINLNASNAASTIQMIGSPTTAAFRIDANGGADDIDIEGNALGNSVTVTSGAGLDTLRLNDDNSGTVRVNLVQSEDLAVLNILAGGLLTVEAGNNKTIDVVTSTTLSGRLDLNDNYLIRRGTTNLPFYDQRLRVGYNGGTWTTSSDLSIFSSVAASAASAKDALGFAQAGAVGIATYGGLAVGANDIVIGYTQYGDTDLDRDVDFDDLLRQAQAYGTTGKFWQNGNFNYDAAGGVTFDDLLLTAQNYGTTLLRGNTSRSVVGTRESDPIVA